jgi:hypothetical protein
MHSAVGDLTIEIGDHFAGSLGPLVPIPPDKRTSVPLFLQKLDPIVQLSHSLRDVLGCFWDPQVFCCQSLGVKVLFKPAVLKGPQKTRSDLLSS